MEKGPVTERKPSQVDYDDFGSASRQISFSVHYKKADLMAESEEIKLTDFFIRHPCKSLLCGYIFLSICLFLSLYFDCFYIPVATGREYLIYNDPIMIEYEQIEEVDKYQLMDLKGKNDGTQEET